MLPDNEFKNAFANASLNIIKQARYVLNSIEIYLREKDMGHPGELEIGKSKNVHVEHVYPKKPTKGHELEDHEDWVDRIGNLTLLASRPNRKAQNAPFHNKKTFFQDSELIHTKELSEFSEWTTSTIVKRQRRLAEIAVSVWPRPA